MTILQIPEFPSNVDDFKSSIRMNKFDNKQLSRLRVVWENNPTIHNSEKTKEKLRFLCDFLDGKLEQIEYVDSYEPDDLAIAKRYISLFESAKRRKKSFTLSISDVRRLLKRKRCHYTGQKMAVTKGNTPHECTLTIDRVDASKGYDPDNVVSCTHWANQIKNDLFEKQDSLARGKESLIKRMMGKL